jgi:hypothetical protein
MLLKRRPNALRVVLLPRFARSEAEGRLAREVSSWALALGALLVPLVVLPLYGFGTQWAWLLLAVLPALVALPFARHVLSRPRAQTEQPG